MLAVQTPMTANMERTLLVRHGPIAAQLGNCHVLVRHGAIAAQLGKYLADPYFCPEAYSFGF
jgi:hypothetical protein